MSKIDSRIVELKFNTKDFEAGVKRTQANMKQLDSALNLQGVAEGVDSVNKKLSPLGVVGFTAFQKLTNAALDFGAKFVKNVIDPIEEGGRSRAMNMEQARFQFQGLGMDVEQSMADALYAVKGTAYGLDEAAMAASMFGASGVKSGTEMQTALRGISGVAAMSGSSYNDMANVFTKVAGQGRVMGDDLNRLSTRGLNAAATIATYMTNSSEFANVTEADVRSMVTKGEIDFKLFSAAMSDAFGEHATKASETFSGSLANVNAALARIGEMKWAPKLEQQRQMFNAITPVVDGVAKALGPFMDMWASFGNMATKYRVNLIEAFGFQDLTNDFTPPIVEALESIVTSITRIVTPIRQAFIDVFRPLGVTAEEAASQAGVVIRFFENLADAIKISDTAVENIRHTFQGLFGILGIVSEVLKSIGSGFVAFFGAIKMGNGNLLGFTGTIGQLIYKFYEIVRDGKLLTNFFEFLGKTAAIPVNAIITLIGWLGDLGGALWGLATDAWNSDFVQGIVSGIQSAVGVVKEALQTIPDLWSTLMTGEFHGGFWEEDSFIISSIIAIRDTFVDFVDSFQTGWQKLTTGTYDNGFWAYSPEILNAIGYIRDGILDFVDATTTALTILFHGDYDGIFWEEDAAIVAALFNIRDAVLDMSGAASEAYQILMHGNFSGAIWDYEAPIVTALFNIRNAYFQARNWIVDSWNGIVASMSGGTLMATSLAWLRDSSVTLWGNIVDVFANSEGTLKGIMKGLGGFFVGAWQGIVAGFEAFGNSFGPVMQWVGTVISDAFKLIGGLFQGFDLDQMMNIIDTTALVLIAKAIYDFVKYLISASDASKTISEGIEEIFSALTSSLAAMQGVINIGTIVAIAGSVALLAGSLVMLSSLDSEAMSTGIIGLGVAFGLLFWSFKGLSKLMTSGAVANIIPMATGILILSASMVVMASAGVVLAAAFAIFSTMSWEELSKGLLGLASGLGVLVGAMKLMNGVNVGNVATQILILSAAMIVLGGAFKVFASMSWAEMAQGLVGVAGGLALMVIAAQQLNGVNPAKAAASILILSGAMVVLGAALKIMGSMSWEEMTIAMLGLAGGLMLMVLAVEKMESTNPAKAAASLLILSAAMVVLSAALKILGTMSIADMAQALIGMAIGLGLMVAAINLMPVDLAGKAASLLVLAAAMVVLSVALKSIGGMSIQDLGIALIGLAGSLLIMVVAMNAMSGAIAGAAAIVAMALALAVLAPVLKAFGSMSFGELGMSLLVLAGALGVLLLAGLGAQYVAIGLLALGAAVLMLGAGAAMAGAGALDFANALEKMGNASEETIDSSIAAIQKFLPLIPEVAGAIGKGIVAIIVSVIDGIGAISESLTANLPVIIEMLVTLIGGLLDALIELVPKMAETATVIIKTLVTTLLDLAPFLIQSGIQLVLDLMQGLTEGMPELIASGADLIVAFLEGLTGETQKIISAGIDLTIEFINGITEGLPQIMPAVTLLIVTFIMELDKQQKTIITAGTQLIINFIMGLSAASEQIRKAGTMAIVKFLDGIGQSVNLIIAAGSKMIVDIMDGMAVEIPKVADSAVNLYETFLDELADSTDAVAEATLEFILDVIQSLTDNINEYAPQIHEAAKELGRALIEGIAPGMSEKIDNLKTSISETVDNVLNWFREFFGIQSPSTKTKEMGGDLIDGLKNGIGDGWETLKTKISETTNNVIDWFKDNLKPEKLLETGKNFLGGVGNGIKNGWEGLKGGVKTTGDKVGGWFKNNLNPKKTLDRGKELLTGVGNGISNRWNNLKSNISGVTKNTVDRFKNGLNTSKTLSRGRELITGIGNGISNRWSNLRTGIGNISKNATDRFKSLLNKGKTKGQGEQLTTGVRDGISGRWSNLRSGITTIATNAIKGFSSRLTAAKTTPYGRRLTTGIRSGVNSAWSGLSGAIGNIARLSLSGFRNRLSGSSLVTSGMNLITGLRNGISRSWGALRGAITNIARNAIARFKSAFKIQSPSRVMMEMGEYVGEGLALGIEDTGGIVGDASTKVADSALENMRDALSDIPNLLDKEMDMNPTIRPVLDLSGVKGGANSLSAMFSSGVLRASVSETQASSLAAMARTIGSPSDVRESGASKTVQFIQNNTSPDPISAADTYRGTKSLISLAMNKGEDL